MYIQTEVSNFRKLENCVLLILDQTVFILRHNVLNLWVFINYHADFFSNTCDTQLFLAPMSRPPVVLQISRIYIMANITYAVLFLILYYSSCDPFYSNVFVSLENCWLESSNRTYHNNVWTGLLTIYIWIKFKMLVLTFKINSLFLMNLFK